MKRRGWFSRLLAISVVLVLVISGCSKGNNGDSASSAPSNTPTSSPVEPSATSSEAPPEENKEPVTIRMLTWNEGYKGLFDLFHKEFPWITVEPVFITTPTIIETVVAQEAAGTPVDILWIDDLSTFIKEDLLDDLKPYMAKDPIIQNTKFNPGFIEQFDINDVRYASPFVYVPTWLAINKDLMSKHGLEMPPNDWTLDDFREMAKKATDPAAGEFGLAHSYLFPLHFLRAVSTANGNAANLDFMNADLTQSVMNTPGVLEDIRWMKEFVTKDGSLASTAKAAELGLDANADFMAGKSLFEFIGDWSLSNLNKNASFEWDVLPLPKGKAKQVTYGMVGAFGLAKASKHKEEAYKWISWQFTKTAQKWKIDQGASASIIDDEVFAYYDETPMWKGKNIEAVKATNQFKCCLSMLQKIPASSTMPLAQTIQIVLGDLEPESVIPLVDQWNAQTVKVRKELGWR
ncbi:hypothetical protein Back11_35020 [Paenibacillus baekrokdamisoli]|uniref:Uncharacterized protein n=1 Tax=Paenibacillus baekrokdamisoli TaxID=1712516 RepID=A0A3G9ITF6_9BACL|nr:extracellular solute-binding protein [Paenibacillus baekrokdamisoli]MBB3070904.1 ABC-type glycerol-3-phosphate transport system substrate-binding protein [Paenibacillus baekrokdamisoli]BBH22157.1 hypothetical protein Back11_35020 [Paenibacillus baekrokdamisoli]